MTIEDVIKELKDYYNKFTLEILYGKSNTTIFFKLKKKDYKSINLKIKNDEVIVNIYYCKGDKTIQVSIKNKDDMGKLYTILNNRFNNLNEYYSVIQTPEKVVSELQTINNIISKNINKDMLDIKIEQVSFRSCMGYISNKNNGKKVIYRLEFLPEGYIATIIYDNPHDEQNDYYLQNEREKFLKDLYWAVDQEDVKLVK